MKLGKACLILFLVVVTTILISWGLRVCAAPLILGGLNTYKLNLDKSDKYRFGGPIPKLRKEHNNLAGKIHYIKKKTRIKTYKDQMGEKADIELPEGLCVFDGLKESDVDFDEVYKDLDDIFDNYENYLHFDQIENRGLLYMFTGKDGRKQQYPSTMRQIKKYHRLSNAIDKYMRHILNIYEIPYTEQFLEDHVQVIFLKYYPNSGIWLHIDNVARYDQGPIITLSFGPEHTYYDFTPTLIEDGEPMRIEINQGDIVVMDGSSRMEWSHGLPYGMEYEKTKNKKTKYTIMFKCDKFKEVNKKYNKILDTNIYSSGVIC